METITAIVPTFNRSAFLSQTLEALLTQSRSVDEIIVWDDGSQDDTPQVVTQLRASLGVERADRLIYFRSPNGGKSKSLNEAMGRARGDLIWICDDDDIALPDAAERLAGVLAADPGLGAVGGSYRRFSIENDVRRESGPGYWPDLSDGSILRHLLEDIFLFQNAMLVRRSCYDAVGPFREDLARSIDYDMVIRLAAHRPMAVVPEPVFLQRKHDGARGPAAARHAAAQSEAVWKAADRDVFARLRKALPLELYDAMFDGPSAQAVRRAALLQRACVYARRTDWTAALEDFGAAAVALPDRGLGDLETAICRRAMAGKHGCTEAQAPDIRRALSRIAAGSVAGRGIANGLARGLIWRLRGAVGDRDPGALAGVGRLMGGLWVSGWRGARHTGDPSPPGEMHERCVLPDSVRRDIDTTLDGVTPGAIDQGSTVDPMSPGSS